MRPSALIPSVVLLAGPLVLAGCSAPADGGPTGRGSGAAPTRASSPASAPAVRAVSPPAAPTVHPDGPGAAATVGVARDVRAVVVLRRWDAARAVAFATGDPRALRRLYVPGSAAGAADLRVLRAYLRRGLRVEGMRMQLLRVDVLQERPRRIRLRVTDRLAGAVAVGAGDRRSLPSDAASTRVVELVRGKAGWQVAEVSG